MAGELNAVLNVIENDLIPLAPLQALPVLTRFIETDSSVLNRSDDSDGMIGDAYRRACHLFGSASQRAGQPQEAEKCFMKLREGDNYGTRDALYDEVNNILTPESLHRVIAEWRFRMQSEAFEDFGGIRVRLMQIAKCIGDPELHEEASLAGRAKDDYPLLAISVAKVYLACGKPELALSKMPSEEACRHNYDREIVLIDIYKAMGNTSEIAKIYWRQFESSASPQSAKHYLQMIPEEDREAALLRIRALVKTGSYSAYRRAIFFAETGDFLSAAEIVEQNENAFANEHYGELLDLAKRLEKNHPLAATILYRANFESILNQAKSKYYGYAASYAVKLRNLSLQIGDWKGLMPHADYWKGIQEDHKRKTAFWDRIGNTLT